MDLTAPRLLDDPVHIPGGDPRAGQDLDAPRRVLDHLPDSAGAKGDVRLLAAGEDPGDPQLDQGVQGLPPVGDHVDGPVEHALLPRLPGQLRQHPGPLQVDGPVGMEESEHQTVRAVVEQQLGILNGGVELRLGVAEAALPGPDHGHDGHPGLPLGHDQLSQGGGQPAVEQVAVQLHPVRAGQMGLDHVVRAAAADF